MTDRQRDREAAFQRQLDNTPIDPAEEALESLCEKESMRLEAMSESMRWLEDAMTGRHEDSCTCHPNDIDPRTGEIQGVCICQRR